MGKAKKSSIKNLPADWQHQLLSLAQEQKSTRPHLPSCISLLWLVGLRPAEIQKGVEISFEPAKDFGGPMHLKITVHGAKSANVAGRQRGQPSRCYHFPLSVSPASVPTHPAVAQLASALNGEKIVTINYDKDYLYNSVVRLGRQAFRRRETISPYSFRHQVGSDLKTSKQSKAEIARFLGHLSDFSQSRYGHPAHGKGKGGIVERVEVEASRAVKHSPKTDKLARFRAVSAMKSKPGNPTI